MAKSTAEYIYDIAVEESLMFIEQDPDLAAMTVKQKRFVLRLMTDRVVDRFFNDLEKKFGKEVQKTEIRFLNCHEKQL